MIYVFVTWLLLATVLAVGLLSPGSGAAAGWGVAPLSMIFVIVVAFAGCRAKPDGDGAAASESLPALQEWGAGAAGASGGAPLITTPTAPPHRLVMFDNARVALIMLVVIGHSGTGFMGSGAFLGFRSVGPSWYEPVGLSALALLKPLVVPLFFLISGYLSAAGRARKGARRFLRASFWRLGPPYFLWWLAINPLNSLFAHVLTRPARPWIYFPGSAATWFLNWLLVFQSCLALLDELPVVALPRWSTLALTALGVAAMQMVASLVCAIAGSTLGLGEMPMTSAGDGFVNALGFAAGALAYTSGWVDVSQPLPARLLRPSRWYVLVASGLVLLFAFLTVAPGAPGAKLVGSPSWAVGWYALQLLLGPYSVCVWLLALDFFQRHCNVETCFTRFLATGAFAVFLLHYWAVTGCTYLFVLYLDSVQGASIQFNNSTQSDTDIGAGNQFLGFFMVATSSIAVSFLVGGTLKRLPLVRRFI